MSPKLKISSGERSKGSGGSIMRAGGRWSGSVATWSAILMAGSVMLSEARAQTQEPLVAASAEEMIELFSKLAANAADVLITDVDGKQTVLVNEEYAEIVAPNQITWPQTLTLEDLVAESITFRFSHNPVCELKKEGGSWVLRPVGCTLP